MSLGEELSAEVRRREAQRQAFDAAITRIPWDLVHAHMQAKNWKWYGRKTAAVPDVWWLCEVATRLFEECVSDHLSALETGGLRVWCTPLEVGIRFKGQGTRPRGERQRLGPVWEAIERVHYPGSQEDGDS